MRAGHAKNGIVWYEGRGNRRVLGALARERTMAWRPEARHLNVPAALLHRAHRSS